VWGAFFKKHPTSSLHSSLFSRFARERDISIFLCKITVKVVGAVKTVENPKGLGIQGFVSLFFHNFLWKSRIFFVDEMWKTFEAFQRSLICLFSSQNPILPVDNSPVAYGTRLFVGF